MNQDKTDAIWALRWRLRTDKWLTHPRFPLGVAALAVVLTLPALGVGWIGDDHYHRLVMVGSAYFGDLLGSPMDMFNFFDGDPQRGERMLETGFLPWWSYPGIQGAFWRPLTVLTHWVDYQLWPQSPELMHAQSLAWFGAVVGAAAVLFRRFMGVTWVAGLAGVLYAVDDAHSIPLAWLANRNALLPVLFGIGAILAHDRWRRDGWKAGAFVGSLCLLAALFSAEAGIATCAYLAAYALFLDCGGLRQRAAALGPYVVVVIGWRVIWSAMGYGAKNLGLYVDPLAEPVRYLGSVARQMPIYLLAQWGLPPADIHMILNDRQFLILWGVGVTFLMALLVVMWPLLRRDRMARFWAVGMVLSVLPFCATFPSDRLLLFIGLGASGLLAQFLNLVFVESRSASADDRVGRLARVFGYGFLVIHLVLAPIALPLRAAYPLGPKAITEGYYIHTPMDDSVTKQTVVVVNPPSAIHAIYTPILRELAGEPIPQATRALVGGLRAVDIERPDARTLIARPDGGFLTFPLDRLFRSERIPMTVGQKVKLPEMTVEVLAMTEDGRPAEAKFTFQVPLEDGSLKWLWWKNGAFAPFDLPAMGSTVRLPAAQSPL